MSRNGADLIVDALARAGVDTCFANPGTTEMHLVAALARNPDMKTHLCLFEGVATGAADGYARMARKPAATLLHLGPGLANGMANLHNARKAGSRVINLVGEHAEAHLSFDAPLTADIAGMADTVSDRVLTLHSGSDIGAETALLAAESAAGLAPVATLIVPNDIAWNEATPSRSVAAEVAPASAAGFDVDKVLHALKSDDALLLVGAPFISDRIARLATAIGAATGARVLAEAAVARMERGAGRVNLKRVPFHVDLALADLQETSHAVLAGAREPIAFFAYPGRSSRLLPESCEVTTLTPVDTDVEAALEALADALGVDEASAPALQPLPDLPENAALTPETLAAVISNALPEDAIVVDESITNGGPLFATCAASAPHDWINNRGGSIGYSWPVAIGAAVACPERRVLAVTGDGSAWYTVQSLWTMARSRLNVTIIVLANRRYNILANEMSRIGAGSPSHNAQPLLMLDEPATDWVALAGAQGVATRRVTDSSELQAALALGFAMAGPMLIEAIL